jgi:hypothetical protein
MPYYPQSPGFYPPLNSVTDAQLADMPDGTVKGREIGSGAGDPANIGRALSYRNILGRNGGFEVWQRGAGGSAAISVGAAGGAYTSDGWWLTTGANQASVVAQGAPGVAGSRFGANIFRSSGQTGVSIMVFEFPLDTDEIVMAQNSIVTLSFIAYCNAGWTPAGQALLVRFRTGTGAAAKRSTVAFTGETDVIAATATLPVGTPQRLTFTSAVVVPTNATQASLQFLWTPVGTAGAADVWAIDDVQLEIGSVATPFERRPFESELQACQRHYQKSFQYGMAPNSGVGINNGELMGQTITGGASSFSMFHSFGVRMRTSPSVAFYNPSAANGQVRNESASVDHSATVAFGAIDRCFGVASTGNAGGGVNQQCGVHWQADAGI